METNPRWKPTKGKYKGHCNVEACQMDISDQPNWLHRLNKMFYCQSHAFRINKANMDYNSKDLCIKVLSKEDNWKEEFGEKYVAAWDVMHPWRKEEALQEEPYATELKWFLRGKNSDYTAMIEVKKLIEHALGSNAITDNGLKEWLDKHISMEYQK